MFLVGPSDVSMLLAAGGPCEWLAGVRWPLHTVLLELGEVVDARPSSLPYSRLASRPDPDTGLAVTGADAAVTTLAEQGVITLTGEGLTICWTVSQERLHSARRDLMRLPPPDAQLLYRAGRRWAALASTVLKNWRTASPSSSATVWSATPKRRHVALAGR